MAIPPKGDPRRQAALAARSMRIIGVIFLLLGGCALIPQFLGARSGRPPTPSWVSIVGMITYATPAILFLAIASAVARSKLWAIITTLVIASLMAVLLLMGMAGLLMITFRTNASRGANSLLIGAAIFEFMFAAIFTELIVRLILAMRMLKIAKEAELQGFDPILLVPQQFQGNDSDRLPK